MSGWKIISGGQTGVDRAALDAARELGLPYGGYVPRGRRTEEGPLPSDYSGMIETEASNFAARTRRNVETADATLILTRGPCEGGTSLTLDSARSCDKPHLVVDLAQTPRQDAVRAILEWLASLGPGTLNVAGPRASRDSSIYADSKSILLAVLRGLAERT